MKLLFRPEPVGGWSEFDRTVIRMVGDSLKIEIKNPKEGGLFGCPLLFEKHAN